MSTNLSYISTPLVGNYIYESLPDRLKCLALEDPDKEAYVFYDSSWKRYSITRQQLLNQSLSLARALVDLGLKKNATVGFCMTNSVEMLFASLAVVCAGGLPFFAGTNLKDGSDLIETLNDMDCEMLLIDTTGDDANWEILENIWPLSSCKPKVDSLKRIICNGIPGNNRHRLALSILMNMEPDSDAQLPEVQPEDHLVCFCTSGSTGKPKEVIHDHTGMFNWTKQTHLLVGLTSKSRLFCDRTFSWAGGYPKFYLVDGLTRIFLDPKLTLAGASIENVCDVIRDECCDVVIVPNYIAVDLLSNPHLASKFDNVRGIILWGERIPKKFVSLKDKFCKNIYIIYGTTEAGYVSVFTAESTEDYEDGIIGRLMA